MTKGFRRLANGMQIVGVAGLFAVAIIVPHKSTAAVACQFPETVQTVTFSQSKYPTIYAHWQEAEKKGWPQVLVLDRNGASGRRTKLLASFPTKDGFDRDEYPPASSREGWLADVKYVPSSENRAQGASLGSQYSKWCNGVRFQYNWTP